MIPIIRDSHYYWVGGPTNLYTSVVSIFFSIIPILSLHNLNSIVVSIIFSITLQSETSRSLEEAAEEAAQPHRPVPLGPPRPLR